MDPGHNKLKSMAQQTMVKLDSKASKPRSFTIQHAERLLNYQVKHKLNDWAIAPNQPFEFKNGVISATGKGKIKDSDK